MVPQGILSSLSFLMPELLVSFITDLSLRIPCGNIIISVMFLYFRAYYANSCCHHSSQIITFPLVTMTTTASNHDNPLSKPLDNKYKEKDNQFYCQLCFDTVIQDVCAACKKAIDGRAIKAASKAWCPEVSNCWFNHKLMKTFGVFLPFIQKCHVFAMTKRTTTTVLTVFSAPILTNLFLLLTHS